MLVNSVKFGITERGDIAFHNEWIEALDSGRVSAAVLISKGLPNKAGEEAIARHRDHVIFHATTTGQGGTVHEPNVKPWQERLDLLMGMLDRTGLKKDHVVIRVDPIIPDTDGIDRAKKVIEYSYDLGFRAFRYSWIDYYRHVEERYKAAGVPIFKTIKNANPALIKEFDAFLAVMESKGCTFASCAESDRHHKGCISVDDFKLCGLDPKDAKGKSQQRAACNCVGNKTELLNHMGRCGHKCLYCFWKDNVKISPEVKARLERLKTRSEIKEEIEMVKNEINPDAVATFIVIGGKFREVGKQFLVNRKSVTDQKVYGIEDFNWISVADAKDAAKYENEKSLTVVAKDFTALSGDFVIEAKIEKEMVTETANETKAEKIVEPVEENQTEQSSEDDFDDFIEEAETAYSQAINNAKVETTTGDFDFDELDSDDDESMDCDF